ncbi:MAG: hypothetical protein KGR46_07960 [Verrucomicrobia bacterium]|nr:hypothetical protein [Verrucomicrobiota bacterium]
MADFLKQFPAIPQAGTADAHSLPMWMQGSAQRLLEALLERLPGVFCLMVADLHPTKKSNNSGSFYASREFVKIVTKLFFALIRARQIVISCPPPKSMCQAFPGVISAFVASPLKSAGWRCFPFQGFQPMGG